MESHEEPKIGREFSDAQARNIQQLLGAIRDYSPGDLPYDENLNITVGGNDPEVVLSYARELLKNKDFWDSLPDTKPAPTGGNLTKKGLQDRLQDWVEQFSE